MANREGDRELDGVERVDLPRLPMPGDELTGRLKVGVEDADRSDGAVPDILEESQAEPVEVTSAISPVRTFFAKTEVPSASVKREIQYSDPTSTRRASTSDEPSSAW